jgi:hypothetical protein
MISFESNLNAADRAAGGYMPTEQRSSEPADSYQAPADLFSPPPDGETQEVPEKLVELWSQWAATRLS